MIILAVDLGDARTGLAACDAQEMLAFPAGTIHETNRDKTLEQVIAAAKERRAELILIGHPINRDGSIGERAKLCAAFAERLQEAVAPLPVQLWDERGTTIAAHAALNLGTTRGKKKRQVVDSVAATILLESYLAYRKSSS